MESSNREALAPGSATADQDAELEISHDVVSASVVILRPVGDLDLFTAPVLYRHLSDQLRRGRHVILDLDGVTFAGSSAIRVLLNAHQLARAHDCALHITTAGRRNLARPFAILGLDTVLLISDDHADTLADHHRS